MNVNAAASTQQTQLRKMDGTGGGQGNAYGKQMQDVLATLPQDVQDNIQSLMQTLNPPEKKDVMREVNELDASNMTVEDLTTAIMDLFGQEQEASKSSFPASFSVYA